MRFKIIFVSIVLFASNHSFAQNINPDQIERSQEIIQEQEGLRQKVSEPQKVFIKEIILPQDCLIPKEEIERIIANFSGYQHSQKEIQELLNVLSQAYQKAYSLNKLPQASYILDEGKLKVDF